MAYNFLPYNQDQLFLMPPSLREWVEEDSLPRFVSDVVDELDGRGKLSGFYAGYRADGWGRAAYHPCLMLKVLLYGYAVGVRSSRKLAEALQHDVGFRYLAANQQPDFRTVSDFRKEHLRALNDLFVEVLELCKGAGLVQMGRVALDGRKVAGNAAPEQSRTREQLQQLVDQILQEAEETDEREDALYGKDKRGDELPEELRTRAGRLKRIREAIAQADAKKREAEAKQAERVRAREEAEQQEGGERRGRKPGATPPRQVLKRVEEFRANPTDPDSRLLKTRHGWVQGYNGQVMVDCSSQVIVAHGLTHEADDRAHLALMLERCEEQAGVRPQQCLADAGYWSEANGRLGNERTALYIAVDNEGKTLGDATKARTKTKQGPEAKKMRAKLETPEAREIYRERSQTVEPVFGQMWLRDLNRFLLRGHVKAGAEWALFCTSHNLLKVWRARWRLQPA